MSTPSLADLARLTLRTPRLLLRPLRAADRKEFIRVHEASREYFAPWTPIRPAGQTLEQFFDEQLARGIEGATTGRDYRYVAEEDESPGTIVGFFNLNMVTRGVFQNAYAGWSVSADAAGLGFGTEGVGGLLSLALLAPPWGLGLHRVQANIMPRNERSIRVAEKNGMRREGHAAKYIQIAGKWEDHIMFAKTCEEHGAVR